MSRIARSRHSQAALAAPFLEHLAARERALLAQRSREFEDPLKHACQTFTSQTVLAATDAINGNWARAASFSLHAGAGCVAHERENLARLCRYMCLKRCDAHYQQWVSNKCGGNRIVKPGDPACLNKGIFEDADIEEQRQGREVAHTKISAYAAAEGV